MVTVTHLTLELGIVVNYFKYKRQVLTTVFLLTSSFFLLTSCQEGGEAGELFGQWRMTESHYISFSGSVTRFCNAAGREVFGNFQHVGDSLIIRCYSKKGDKSDTIMIEDSFGFKPMNNIRLKITTIDSDRLILSQGSRSWSFIKY